MKKILPVVLSVTLAIACIVLGFVKGIYLDDVQKRTLNILGIICASSMAYCFIVGEISRNNSQMDKLWSVLPIAYVWVVTALGGFRWRLIIIAIIVTLWGVRLTYNFAKKGAYSIKFWTGEEDYRWVYLRGQKPFTNKLVWGIFDLGFISIWQNIVVLGITLPAVAIMTSNAPFNALDVIAGVLMFGALLYEVIADRQQNNFQTKKYEYLNKGMKLEDLPEPYNRGFNVTGLWSRSRHPNYIGEQLIWVGLYLFAISGGAAHFGVFNWTITGVMLLILIFVGSSRMAEGISVKKYPEYPEYQKQVFRYLPLRKYKGDSQKQN